MHKTTKLSRAAFLIAVSFGVNKLLAIGRQLIIARQFGLSSDLDVFNVANNVPDMLYSLISGGALAVAIIPVLTEVMAKENRKAAWKVFSSIANLAFLITALLSAFAAVFAWPLVQHPLGIAPGFTFEQQALVVRLMRFDLVATLVFSMAGLLIAGLQANQHFLLPAIGPILYNFGQIFGAVILAPQEGYSFGPVTLPAYGLGVDGLVYGVLIGSALYFLIQIPGLVVYRFKWIPAMNIRHPDVRKILVMLGPRVASMLMYQLTFITRDNLASHLPQGSVTALTYGWMILQLPETLIGTAIGTALLPTISEQIAKKKFEEFHTTVTRVIRVLIALAVPSAVLLYVSLPPFLEFAFGFDAAGTAMLLWVTRAFLVGLLSHCLLELSARIFFAQQNAILPFIAAGLSFTAYILSGFLLAQKLQAPGLGLADAISFTVQSGFLLIAYKLRTFKRKERKIGMNNLPKALATERNTQATWFRTIIGSATGAAVISLILRFSQGLFHNLTIGIVAALIGLLMTFPFIRKELQILFRL